MSGPSQRAAERQAARRGAAASPRKRGRVRSAADAVRDRPTLTGRAVVLAVVLGMLVLVRHQRNVREAWAAFRS